MKTITLNIPDARDLGNGVRDTAKSAGNGIRSGTHAARTKLAGWIAPKPARPAKKKATKKKVAKR